MNGIAIMEHLERKYNMAVSSGMVEIILQAIECRELSPIFEDMIEISGREISLGILQIILAPVE